MAEEKGRQELYVRSMIRLHLAKTNDRSKENSRSDKKRDDRDIFINEYRKNSDDDVQFACEGCLDHLSLDSFQM